MKYDALFVRFGELFLKGRNRAMFVSRVRQTIARKLARFPGLKADGAQDHLRIFLGEHDPVPVIAALKQVFGLHSISLAATCPSTIEDICATALNVVKETVLPTTAMKFETRRTWKDFPITSMELSRSVGDYVYERTPVTYNIGSPDHIVKIIIHKERSYIIGEEILGAGGLPIGVNGGALLMLSGGLDSPVAAYLMMKRGIAVDALHFESPPHTSIKAKQKVLDLAEKLAHYMPTEKMTVLTVPFTKLQKAIFENCHESYAMTIMRRMMYRVTEGVAKRRGALLLANGESLGQVASQTPHSMLAINEVVSMPVIRPVACMDKGEIIPIARAINTFDISIRPFEDCCTVFVPKSPCTAPSAEKCQQYEARFEWEELVKEAILNTKPMTVIAGAPLILDEETTDEICALL